MQENIAQTSAETNASGKPSRKLIAVPGVQNLRRNPATGVYVFWGKFSGHRYNEALRVNGQCVTVKEVALQLVAKRRKEILSNHAAGVTVALHWTLDYALEQFSADNDRAEAKGPDVPEGRSEQTAKYYREIVGILRNYLPKHALATDVKKINYADNLKQWFKPIVDDYSETRSNGCKTVLIQTFSLAKDARACSDNPALEIPHRVAKKKTIHPPTWEQVLLICEAVVERQSKNFIKFLALTGARVSEPGSVLLTGVNLQPRTPENPNGSRVHFPKCKGNKERWYPISPELREVLDAQLALRAEPKVTDKSSPYLFTIKDVKKSLAKACKDLGFPHWTHHDFRHFWTTAQIEQSGVSRLTIPDIAKLRGDADNGELLLRTYTHVRLNPVYEKAANVYFGAKPEALAEHVG